MYDSLLEKTRGTILASGMAVSSASKVFPPLHSVLVCNYFLLELNRLVQWLCVPSGKSHSRSLTAGKIALSPNNVNNNNNKKL